MSHDCGSCALSPQRPEVVAGGHDFVVAVAGAAVPSDLFYRLLSGTLVPLAAAGLVAVLRILTTLVVSWALSQTVLRGATATGARPAGWS